MTIKSIKDRPLPDKIEIDLTGPNGNAFYVMARVRESAKPLGLDPDKIIWDEMMKANSYDELLEIFDGYFGDYVILYR